MRFHFKTLSFGLADQGLASAVNLIISVAVLRYSDGTEAYEFATLFIVMTLAVGLVRSLTSEVLAVDGSADRPPAHHASNVHFIQGVALGAGVLATAAAIMRVETEIGILMMIAGSFAVGGDAVRQTYISVLRPSVASSLNSFLLILVVAGAGIAVMQGRGEPTLIAWGVGNALTGLWVMLRSHWGCGVRDLLRFRRFTYALEFAATAGATQATLLILIAAGIQDLAAAQRSLVTLFGPYLVFFQGIAIIAVPICVRAYKSRNPTKVGYAAMSISFSLLLLAGTYAVVAHVVGGLYGSRLFGDSWTVAQSVLGQFTLATLATALMAGPLLAVRATGDPSASLRLRTVSAMLQLSIPLATGLGWGVGGYFLGLAVSQLIASTYGFRIAMTNRRQGAR